MFPDKRQYAVFLTILKKLVFSVIYNFTEIRSKQIELSHAHGRTDGPSDMTKLIVAFLKFAKMIKISSFSKRT